ncbi:MAG: F0F1 ATP synthase subunit gamma [Clostridia bacterium]|nr:F0F1 ATP synthase subunit gamma [Clostridia bacterium]
MATLKELKGRIKSVRDTSKVTGAMYMISSMKLQSASSSLSGTEPYFRSLERELARVSGGVTAQDCAFMRRKEGTAGVFVIASDKGLCGDYNRRIIREAERVIDENPGCELFVIGEKAKKHFASGQFAVREDFGFKLSKPGEELSYAISGYFCDLFLKEEISRLIAVYAAAGGSQTKVLAKTVLPIEPPAEDSPTGKNFEFLPSKAAVVDSFVPVYLSGVFHSILLHGFIGEHSARMFAMDSANRNAKQLLDDLNLQYNHLRQNAITTEIAEISGERNRQ